jgi:hypothetical protein
MAGWSALGVCMLRASCELCHSNNHSKFMARGLRSKSNRDEYLEKNSKKRLYMQGDMVRDDRE